MDSHDVTTDVRPPIRPALQRRKSMRDPWYVCGPSLYWVKFSTVPLDGLARALKAPPSLIRQMEPATVLRRRVFRHSAAASVAG